MSDTSVRAIRAPEQPIRVTISPRGDVIATVEGNLVRLWSWPSLQPMKTIEGHADAIYRAEFSPDGTMLVTVSRDVTARTWAIDSGAEIARMSLANPAFAAATFSPDGALAATCAWERDDEGQVHGLVWLWDPKSGEVRAKERIGIKPLSSVRFAPDGVHVLVGSWDPYVHVLDLAGREVRRCTMPDNGTYNAVNDIAISPDGHVVAAASKDHTIRVFEIGTGALVATLEGHLGWVEGVVFSPDGQWLSSASADATVRIWRTSDWSAADVLRGHTATVRGGAWTPGGSGLISCSYDGTLREWALDQLRAPVRIVPTGENAAWGLDCSPDGSQIALATHDGELHLYDARSGDKLVAWDAHAPQTCHNAHFSMDGSRIITCSWDKTARVWERATHHLIATLRANAGVYDCDIAPDGSLAALTGNDEVLLFEIGRDAKPTSLAAPGLGGRVAFSADGRMLAARVEGEVVRIWAAPDWSLTRELHDAGQGVESITFSRDGTSIVTGDGTGAVRCIDVATGQVLFVCDTGDRGVNCVRISPDGARIAAGSEHLHIIDARAGERVLEWAPHKELIWDLAWSPDGLTLYTGSADGTFGVLRAP